MLGNRGRDYLIGLGGREGTHSAQMNTELIWNETYAFIPVLFIKLDTLVYQWFRATLRNSIVFYQGHVHQFPKALAHTFRKYDYFFYLPFLCIFKKNKELNIWKDAKMSCNVLFLYVRRKLDIMVVNCFLKVQFKLQNQTATRWLIMAGIFIVTWVSFNA